MSDNADRYSREAEECRQNAQNALRPIDREAWLRLAADWARLAASAQLNRRLSLGAATWRPPSGGGRG
jgi:hypothetical protein